MRSLTLKEAIEQLERVDQVYMKEYTEYCKVTGQQPSGPPGYGQFQTIAEVLGIIEKRRTQILEYSEHTAMFKAKEGDKRSSARIHAISKELGIDFPYA